MDLEEYAQVPKKKKHAILFLLFYLLVFLLVAVFKWFGVVSM